MRSNINEVPIQLYIANTEALSEASTFDYWYERASEDRRNKIDRMKNVADRIRSLSAGVLLQRAYHDLLSDSQWENYNLPQDLPKIVVGKNQKPLFDLSDANAASGASDLYFNLSHSGNSVICAFSIKPVGCDVEQFYREETSDDTSIDKRDKELLRKRKIAKRFFAESENRYLEDDTDSFFERFTTIWTLKESVLKLTGDGIGYPLQSFSVIENNSVADKITIDSYDESIFLKTYPSSGDVIFSCSGLHNSMPESPKYMDLRV